MVRARRKKVARFSPAIRERAEALRRAAALIKIKARQGAVTLLYAARDQEHNEAVVLKELFERS
jgi:uncharacterized protein YeaO (DUF488 family)